MKENKYIAKDELYGIVCENIKKYRMERKLTQLQLSEDIEISHEYLRQLESKKGQKDFTFYTLYKISIALHMPIDAFLK